MRNLLLVLLILIFLNISLNYWFIRLSLCWYKKSNTNYNNDYDDNNSSNKICEQSSNFVEISVNQMTDFMILEMLILNISQDLF